MLQIRIFFSNTFETVKRGYEILNLKKKKKYNELDKRLQSVFIWVINSKIYTPALLCKEEHRARARGDHQPAGQDRVRGEAVSRKPS